MLLQPIRHAWRSLWRTPVFTVTAVLTLVIGIAATVAMFTLVNGVLLRPLAYGNPDRLVGAWFDLPPINLQHAQQTQTTYYTFQRLAHSIDGIALYQEGSADVSDPSGQTEPQHLTSAWITATLLPVMQVSPMIGRNFTQEEDSPTGGSRSLDGSGPSVVLISEGLWRTRFGADPGILKRTMTVNGRTREIAGVMPSRFRFPSGETQVWLPLGLDPASRYPGGFNYNAVARLKPGVTPAAAQRDFAAVLPRITELYPDFAPGISSQMLLDQTRPVPVIAPLREDMTGGIAKTLWILAVAAGLVLLVSCANVSNLILVRADGRQREFALREALGAGRIRLVSHFFTEAAVLSGIAALLGFGLATLGIRLLVATGPANIPRLDEVGMGPAAGVAAIVVALFVAGFCSVIPALRVARLGNGNLSNTLREGGRSGTSRGQQRVRSALVAAQIALALVVLAGSGLLIRTFQRLHAVRPGFDPGQVATMWMSLPQARYPNDSSVARFYAELERRVEQIPGVQAVGLTSRLPLGTTGMNQNPFYPEGDDQYAQKVPPLQLYSTVNADYFRAMSIPLIAGRTFDKLESQRDGVALISRQTAIQFFHDSTGVAALGKQFRSLPSGPAYTVIGVVGGTRDTSLAAPPTQVVYFPEVAERDPTFSQTNRTMALVIRTTRDPASVTSEARAVVRSMDPSLPLFDVMPMTQVFRASMAQLSFVILILGAAAAVTLLLGAIGLYGVMAYVVTLRSRELGVRIALGAQPSSVALMMTRQGMLLTGLGVAGGLALFAGVARFLRSFLYGVAPGDPVALGSAAVLLLAIAMLASWIPARRAARVDPAQTLRND